MKYRFEIQGLAELGINGPPMRLPLRCWRATFNIQADSSRVWIDGQDVGLNTLAIGNAPNMAMWVVGGVILPNGQPVQINQDVIVKTSGDFLRGFIIYEYLEP